MFNAINEKTLYIFAACNVITIPMVWALYPETANRTLEEMNMLFASDSPWNWDAEKTFAELKAKGEEVTAEGGTTQRKGSRISLGDDHKV